MKRVCLFVENLAKQGGEERMCVTLANMLVDAGCYVMVVDQERPYLKSPLYKLSSKTHSWILNGCRLERIFARTPFLKQLSLLKYKMILAICRIDVVIDVDIHRSLFTSKAVSGKNIKIISWDHFIYDRFITRPTRQVLHDCFIEHIDKLVVLSKSDLRAYVEREGLPRQMMAQIYNPSPIQCNTLTSHKGSHKILAVGRLSWEKGFDRLIEAWRLVEQKGVDDWELEIVGDGPMRKDLIEQIKRNQLQRVSLLPFTDYIKEKYEEAAFLVITSVFEGFSLAMVEALTMSLPVISFHLTGPDEIIVDGENGFLVEQGNIDAFADKILYLMDNDQKREEMGRNAFHSSSQFRFENISSQWISLIESL